MSNVFSPPHQISANDWDKFKAARIRAVADSPSAFGDTLEQVESYPDNYWVEGIKNSQVFVINIDGDYVATVVLKQDDDGVWSIKSLWTEPEYRGNGLATQLLHTVIDTAKATGITEIELGINCSQSAAITLYESFGFRTVKAIPNVSMGDGSTNTLLVMRLTLI